jgi:hypothetical protein
MVRCRFGDRVVHFSDRTIRRRREVDEAAHAFGQRPAFPPEERRALGARIATRGAIVPLASPALTMLRRTACPGTRPNRPVPKGHRRHAAQGSVAPLRNVHTTPRNVAKVLMRAMVFLLLVRSAYVSSAARGRATDRADRVSFRLYRV